PDNGLTERANQFLVHALSKGRILPWIDALPQCRLKDLFVASSRIPGFTDYLPNLLARPRGNSKLRLKRIKESFGVRLLAIAPPFASEDRCSGEVSVSPLHESAEGFSI